MNDKYLAEARRILVDIAKQKGHYDDSFTNFLVTPEELAPYLAKQDRESRIAELRYLLEDFGIEDNTRPIKIRLAELTRLTKQPAPEEEKR